VIKALRNGAAVNTHTLTDTHTRNPNPSLPTSPQISPRHPFRSTLTPPSHPYSLGFDHTGRLSAGLKSSLDAFTVHATGSIDLNRRNVSRVGIEVSYELD
jgi:hypothetical protein